MPGKKGEEKKDKEKKDKDKKDKGDKDHKSSLRKRKDKKEEKESLEVPKGNVPKSPSTGHLAKSPPLSPKDRSPTSPHIPKSPSTPRIASLRPQRDSRPELAELRDRPEYTDLVFVIDKKDEYFAHQFLLEAHGLKLPKSAKPDKNGRLPLSPNDLGPALSARSLPALLAYLYSGEAEGLPTGEALVELLVAADVLKLPRLRWYCVEALKAVGLLEKMELAPSCAAVRKTCTVAWDICYETFAEKYLEFVSSPNAALKLGTLFQEFVADYATNKADHHHYEHPAEAPPNPLPQVEERIFANREHTADVLVSCAGGGVLRAHAAYLALLSGPLRHLLEQQRPDKKSHQREMALPASRPVVEAVLASCYVNAPVTDVSISLALWEFSLAMDLYLRTTASGLVMTIEDPAQSLRILLLVDTEAVRKADPDMAAALREKHVEMAAGALRQQDLNSIRSEDVLYKHKHGSVPVDILLAYQRNFRGTSPPRAKRLPPKPLPPSPPAEPDLVDLSDDEGSPPPAKSLPPAPKKSSSPPASPPSKRPDKADSKKEKKKEEEARKKKEEEEAKKEEERRRKEEREHEERKEEERRKDEEQRKEDERKEQEREEAEREAEQRKKEKEKAEAEAEKRRKEEEEEEEERQRKESEKREKAQADRIAEERKLEERRRQEEEDRRKAEEENKRKEEARRKEEEQKQQEEAKQDQLRAAHAALQPKLAKKPLADALKAAARDLVVSAQSSSFLEKARLVAEAARTLDERNATNLAGDVIRAARDVHNAPTPDEALKRALVNAFGVLQKELNTIQ